MSALARRWLTRPLSPAPSAPWGARHPPPPIPVYAPPPTHTHAARLPDLQGTLTASTVLNMYNSEQGDGSELILLSELQVGGGARVPPGWSPRTPHHSSPPGHPPGLPGGT